MRLYEIPFSANVERVTLALAHKGLSVEKIMSDPADRAPIRAISGQDLVPVLVEDDRRVIFDSTVILRRLEAIRPDRPLWPRDHARRAELDVFADWFNRVWKVAPNTIYGELDSPAPDQARITALGREMREALDLFEDLLDGRDFLYGARLTAADCLAFPFLKFAALPPDPADDEFFHRILVDHQPLTDNHPGLAAWIRRVDGLPRA
jgi:glutathione S-transferase